MNKPLSFLVGLSLLASSVPAFAQSASSVSSSSVSSVSSSSSSSSSVASSSSASSRPCADKTNLAKVICLREAALANAKKNKSIDRRQNLDVLNRVEACRSKTGLEKALCIQKGMMKPKMEKHIEKLEQKAKNVLGRRALRNAVKDMRMERKGMRSSRSSASSSSSSVSSSSSSSSSSVSSSSSASSN